MAGRHRWLGNLYRGALAACAILLAAIPHALAKPDARVALVIGNSAYRQVSQLTNPVSDANDVGDSLERLGFSVRRVTDGSYDDIRRALLDFNRVARNVEMAVIYFAGHGIEIGGENWLIPVDAELKSDTDVGHEAVGLKVLMFSVASASQLGLVILDDCRNNPFAANMMRTIRTRSISRGLAGVEPTGNVLVAFAAKEGTTAADGTGRNSPFTGSLLKHLETPGLEVNFLFRNVRDDVIRVTNHEQQPFVYGSLSRNEIFFKPAITDPDAIRRDYEFAASIGTKEAWTSFLGVHQLGLYSDFARAALAKIIVAEEAEAEAAAGQALEEAIEKEKQHWAEIGQALKAADEKAGTEAENAQTRLAALPPDPDRPEIVRSLKSELLRVGCFADTIDTDWNDASRRALAKFGAQSGETFNLDTPSRETLAAVKSRSARVCPLECGRGTRIKGDRCVAIICPRGQALSTNGACESVGRPEAPRTKEVTPPRRIIPPAKAAARQGRPTARSVTGTAASGGRAPYPHACPRGDVAKCRANCAAGWTRACRFLARQKF